MNTAYPHLFKPVAIGKVIIKNRVAMAPMGIIGLTEPDGNPSQRAIDYYIERARGGTGLIITSVFKVENEIEGNVHNMHQINHASIIPFGELCEMVHSLGTKIFVQLTAGFGRVAPLRILRSRPVSASAVPNYSDPSVICRPLEISEIEQIVRSFGEAAAILAACGVDGIELHGHEGYLLDQFTSELWNSRTDKYGGSLEKRLAFPVEVLREIKQRAGNHFPVQYRFGLKHYIKGLHSGALPGEDYAEAGRDIPEGLKMAGLLEEAGFDALHVDAGCYDSWYWAHPPGYQQHGCMADMAAAVKKIVRIPVIAVGRLDIPELAEKVVAGGEADIVALGRGLLADPAWTAKTAAGKTAAIRPCIGCHDGCIGRFLGGKPLSCAVNPSCGRERLYRLTRTDEPQKVLVIGGGIAGMEAARIAALRGHKVDLYEQKAHLGGHLVEASVPLFKKDLAALLAWYKNELLNSRVNVNLGAKVSETSIEAERPDVVVVATGSLPLVPDIPGIEDGRVITCIDLLLGYKTAGGNVIVIGGGLVGCETALWLAQQGRKVTIIEMLDGLMLGAPVVPEMNRTMLLDLLTKHTVDIMTKTRAQAVTPQGLAVLKSDGHVESLYSDTVVVAAGLQPDNRLFQSLSGKIARLYSAGDCVQPRNIMGAIWDGFEIGRSI
ncbi:MAG: FAD-dependent oxidoreductase [Dehalococcoidales bacterium]|nr:FAD-dependent oxidoreductase [Dehalococcoidales bacterium]